MLRQFLYDETGSAEFLFTIIVMLIILLIIVFRRQLAEFWIKLTSPIDPGGMIEDDFEVR